jgi:anti-sigma factor RsiW
MNCDEFVELVTAHLDATVDSTDARRFAEHLAECAGCDRYLDQIRRTVTELGHLPAGDLPGELRDQLLTAFRARSGR